VLTPDTRNLNRLRRNFFIENSIYIFLKLEPTKIVSTRLFF